MKKLPALSCLCFAALLAASTPALRADVALAPVLADGAVLQRGMPVKVWGTADEGEKITVHLRGQEGSAVGGGPHYPWVITLNPLKEGEPLELVVEGKNKIVIRDLILGEVWVCSGQSNMRTNLDDRVPDRERIIAGAEDPKLRIFDLGNAGAGWVKSTPKAARGFATVPYVLARDLRADLRVPVGVVLTAVNGSAIESWLHPDTLRSIPNLPKEYQSFFFGPAVDSVCRFSARGVVWYQGESNSDRREHAVFYKTMLAALIADWRKSWGQEDLPFVVVQIAPYHKMGDAPGESALADVREAQRQVALAIPHTALVVTTDLGEEGDIHPHNKEPTGQRAALAARALAYGEKIESSGPVLEKATPAAEGAVELKFTHAAGLVAHSGRVTGLTLAGADRRFIAADDARIDGEKIRITSKAVAHPAFVRFGWSDFPVTDLWNAAGLPASPFEAEVASR
jgi:sialate O-acetylesterase